MQIFFLGTSDSVKLHAGFHICFSTIMIKGMMLRFDFIQVVVKSPRRFRFSLSQINSISRNLLNYYETIKARHKIFLLM